MADTTTLPLVGQDDLFVLGSLAGGCLLTSVAPKSWDPWMADQIVSLAARPKSERVLRLRDTMRRVLGPSVTADRALVLAQQHHRMRFELRLGRLRGMRSRGWRPKIELQGARFLREALAQGRGVILWRMLFCSNPVVMQALERNGTPLVHLSNVYHGAPSRSRLGIRFVSPLYCRPENDYLAKRVIIPLDGSLGYMRTLLDSLRQNACVSVVGEHRGRQNVSVSFFGTNPSYLFSATFPE